MKELEKNYKKNECYMKIAQKSTKRWKTPNFAKGQNNKLLPQITSITTQSPSHSTFGTISHTEVNIKNNKMTNPRDKRLHLSTECSDAFQ